MPGTPDSIEEAYVRQFQEGFEQAYQQTESIFDPLVERDTQASEYKSWQRIGEAEEMTEDNTRYGDNPTSEIPHDNRRISLRHFELGKHIDEKDLMKVVSDPQNAYSQALLASGKRKRDDFIIEKYFDVAYTGKEGSVTVPFAALTSDGDYSDVKVGSISAGSSNPITGAESRYTLVNGAEGMSVGVGFNLDGSTTETGLTSDKLQAIRSTMLKVEAIDQDTKLPCVVTHRQLEDLIQDAVVHNRDTSPFYALAEGKINEWMGFRFIQSERIPLIGDERRVMVFTPKAFKLTIGEDLKGDMWRDLSKKKIPYMYFKQSIGGSRMWGEVAGEIRCKE